MCSINISSNYYCKRHLEQNNRFKVGKYKNSTKNKIGQANTSENKWGILSKYDGLKMLPLPTKNPLKL